MMQSLLLNGPANLKGNDLKVQEESNNRVNSLNDSKLAEQQRRFAKVMQDNIDKEKAQQRNAVRPQEVNKNNDIQVRDKREQDSAASTHNKQVNESESIQKTTNNKSLSTDNQKTNENEKIKSVDGDEEVEDSIKLTKDIKVDSDLFVLSDEKVKIEDEESISDEDSEKATSEINGLPVENEFELISSDAINMNDGSIGSITQVPDESLLEEGEQETNTDIPLGNNPLLSQIEEAQQVDTNVKNNKEGDASELSIAMLKKQSDNVSNSKGQLDSMDGEKNLVEGMSSDDEKIQLDDATELDAKIKLTAEVENGLKNKTATELEAKIDNDIDKKSKVKLDVDNNLAKDIDGLETGESEGSSADMLKTLEKTEQLSTLIKNETANTNQAIVDVNGARPNQTSQMQLDKLVAFNQQAPAANNLLQEPLDIQSKHAASMMGERIMMMLSQGKQEVEIRLDPAELGSMLIKMQVKQDQVQLHIQTQAGLSKDIIEQNMPRLREQLAQQGIQLSEANVQQQSQQQSQQQQQRQMQVNTGSGQLANSQENVNDQKSIFIPSKIPSLEQGIDYYA